MKIASIKLTTLGAMLSLLALTACGGGGGAGVEDDSPEANAFRYRQAVMRVIARKMGPMGAMARGDAPVDDAAFRRAASELAVMAGMVTEGFMPEGAIAGSAALPEIWTNWDDFSQKAADLQAAADALATATASGGFEAGQSLVQSTAGTCGGCHRGYRRRAEE